MKPKITSKIKIEQLEQFQIEEINDVEAAQINGGYGKYSGPEFKSMDEAQAYEPIRLSRKTRKK